MHFGAQEETVRSFPPFQGRGPLGEKGADNGLFKRFSNGALS